jgi:outer membrane lipoprotein carrier protein
VSALLVALLFAGGGSETDALLERIQGRYESVQDLRASFEQVSFVATLSREQRTRGRVVVQRPGRMRWEYAEPQPSVMVLDIDTVSVYSPVDKKLQIAPLEQGAVSPTALDFLLGEGVLRETFVAELLPSEGRPEVGLRLKPAEEAGFESLDLWLDADTLALRESVLRDLFGNRTRIRLEEVRENAGVTEADFRIEVPDDVEVIDLR